MKGIYASVMMWMFVMVLIMGMLWMFSYETTRSTLSRSHKQALRSTMIECSNRVCDQQAAFDTFSKYFDHHNHVDDLSWALMGFNQDPLLIRMKISAQKHHPWASFKITLDESMIQEVDYE